MGILNTVVKNCFGTYYTLKLPCESNPHLALKPESFWNDTSTRQFINNLTVSSGYWREIISQYSNQPSPSSMTINEIEQRVSNLMMQGQLKVFQIDVPDTVEHPPENRAVKTKENITYLFAPLSTLLTTSPKEVKYFARQKDAKEFLTTLDLDTDKLTTLAAELNIDIASNVQGNSEKTLETLSSALVAGTTIVMVDRFTSTPATEKVLESSGPGNQQAGLGSDTTAKASPAQEESTLNQPSQSATLVNASDNGSAFCEECEKAKASTNK